jgi:hypothetical protein
MQTSFPEDARWNAERQAVEFGGEIGEYRGVVGFRAGCSSACRRNRPLRAVRRGVLPAARRHVPVMALTPAPMCSLLAFRRKAWPAVTRFRYHCIGVGAIGDGGGYSTGLSKRS